MQLNQGLFQDNGGCGYVLKPEFMLCGTYWLLVCSLFENLALLLFVWKKYFLFVIYCWPDCKPEGPLFSAEFVCLSVCLCVSLTGTSTLQLDRFWWNLVTRTLLWSSVAATIMVQIGHRGTARRLFENFKKFSKITEFEFQNCGPSFVASVSPVYCKKIRLNSNKTDRGDTFWSLPLSP